MWKKSKKKLNKGNSLMKTEVLDDDLIDSEEDEINEDRDMEHRKKIEEGMRQWAEASHCRCEVINCYFNNPETISGEVLLTLAIPL
jgi:hypothetical protein